MPLSAPMSPYRWAIDLTRLLDAAKGLDRYPVDVEELILEISARRWPSDPVLAIRSEAIRGFEGALVPVRDQGGWLIISNSGATPGRRRFTVAHEVGHYLLHRHRIPATGIYCKEDDVSRRGGSVLIEKEADTFAAALLMPSHDLRRQIDPKNKPSLDELGALAERYGVSFTAAVLRWLEHTDRRAVMVVSTDGYALWARSSGPAMKSGRYIKTSGAPFEIPSTSGAAQPLLVEQCRAGISHPPGVWFDEEVDELTIHAKAYDQVISLLHLGEARSIWRPLDEEHEPDVVDRFEGARSLR